MRATNDVFLFPLIDWRRKSDSHLYSPILKKMMEQNIGENFRDDDEMAKS